MRAFPPARRTRSRGWRLRAVFRLPGRSTMPWNGCSRSRAGKALSRSPAGSFRQSRARPGAIRSSRSPKLWTFACRIPGRNLRNRLAGTVPRRLVPEPMGTAIGSRIRRRSSCSRPKARSRARRALRRMLRSRMTVEVIAEACRKRIRRPHHLPLLLRTQRLRLQGDRRGRAGPCAPGGASCARRSCAVFSCSGLITLLEHAFQQVMHALIHDVIRWCSTDARRRAAPESDPGAARGLARVGDPMSVQPPAHVRAAVE